MTVRIGAHPLARRQAGAALVMGMIFLVLITVLGLTTMGVSALEERMAGNARDRIRAFQAAEAALRFCETFVTANPGTLFDGNNGMYQPAAAGQAPRWKSIDWKDNATARTYNGNIALLDSQPRCIAEELGTVSEGSLKAPAPQTYGFYRVTARGVGASGNTVVLLQSTLKLQIGS